MTIIKILLAAFLLFIVAIFLRKQSGGIRELEEGGCAFRLDPDDCSNYFNCLGVAMQCGAGQRFDASEGRCRNYFLVECGDRYNPPNLEGDDAEVMCTQWDQTGHGRHFPSPVCNSFRQCFREHFGGLGFSDESCGTYRYDIEQSQCRAPAEVDCGSRS